MPNNIEDLDQEIQECLDTFQNAVFGEDVRSALIQAIEICYEKVVELAVTHILSGKSAYQLAQENGFSGTLQEWLDSLKGDPGPTGPQGPEGPPGRIEGDGFDVDNVIDANSTNPVQNRVIKAALDEKLDAYRIDVPTGHNREFLYANAAGIIKTSNIRTGGTTISNSQGSSLLAREEAVKNYTYSKAESDARYLQEHQDVSGKANISDIYTKAQSDSRYVKFSNVDAFINPNSTNPVRNMAIAEALANLPQPTITIDDQLSPSSTNPVQNKVIAEALQDVVTDNIIWEDIDASLSFENPDNDFSGYDWFPYSGLFVERYYDSSYNDSGDADSTKYRYFLSYIDSNVPSDNIDPTSSHWHRIIELTGLFESNQWKCQNVHNIPVIGDKETYYPSVSCMESYVLEKLNDRLGNFTRSSLELLAQGYDDLNNRVATLENQ